MRIFHIFRDTASHDFDAFPSKHIIFRHCVMCVRVWAPKSMYDVYPIFSWIMSDVSAILRSGNSANHRFMAFWFLLSLQTLHSDSAMRTYLNVHQMYALTWIWKIIRTTSVHMEICMTQWLNLWIKLAIEIICFSF